MGWDADILRTKKGSTGMKATEKTTAAQLRQQERGNPESRAVRSDLRCSGLHLT